MEILETFKNYLLSGNQASSKVTVKNYLADVRKFVNWFESTCGKSFNPQEIKQETIESFRKFQFDHGAATSTERYLSSLRKFFSFLRTQGVVTDNPFEKLPQQREEEDILYLKQFKNHLYLNNASPLTIKNYIIDIKQFLSWAVVVLGVTKQNVLALITPDLVEEYKSRLFEEKVFSATSINRKLSSLRKYLSWATAQGYLSQTKIVSANQNQLSPQAAVGALSESPIDISLVQHNQIENFSAKKITYSSFPPLRLLQKIHKGVNYLFELLFVVTVAKIVLSCKQQSWKAARTQLFSQEVPGFQTKKSFFTRVSNISKSVFAPHDIQLASLPWYKKLWHHLTHTRPAWYKRYQHYAVAKYFNFAVVVIFAVILGVGMYSAFFGKGKTAGFASAPIAPLRILSFQGRLTDNSGNPITTAKNLRFIIYNDPSSSGSARLWEEVDNVSPDSDGIFSILLGSNGSGGNASLCNSGNPPTSPATGACGIPQSLFAQNNTLYLAITVENGTELTPRQQLATVAYATNAEVLQGLPPTTDAGVTGNANAVLALNSSGTVSIPGNANATTTFQAAASNIKLTGQTAIIGTNAGSNGNVQLSPDGLGFIDLQRPLQNSTNLNNIATAVGSVEVDDLFSVLATSSGQSAFTLNQNGTGPLISASASGFAKFTVDNSGAVTAAQYIDKDNTAYFLDPASAGNALIINGSAGIGTTNPSSFKLQVAGSVGPDANDTYDLGSNPSTGGKEWNNLYVKTIFANGQQITQLFQRNSGVLSPLNITDDITIGGTATSSAKFQAYGLANGSIPAGTASTSGYLSFAGTTTTAHQVNILDNGTLGLYNSPGGNSGIGSTPALFINNNGNVGIENSSPQYALDVSGDINQSTNKYLRSGGNIIIGGTGTNTIIRPATSGQAIQIQNFASSALHTFNDNGTIGFNTTSPLATLDVRGTSFTTPVASISGANGKASLVVDQSNIGDIFTASSSGASRFTIQNDGTLIANKYSTDKGLLYLNGTTGTLAETAQGASHTVLHGNGSSAPSFSAIDLTADVGSSVLPIANGGTNGTATPTNGQVAYGTGTAYAFTTGGSAGQCLTFNASAAPTWAACSTGSAGTNYWTLAPLNGAITPINSTYDLLVGGQATSSAKFAILNLGDTSATNNPTASISATSGNNAGNGIYLTSSGTIQSLRNNGLTIGGSTTGNITLSPLNGNGSVTLNGIALDTTQTTFTLLATATTLGIGNSSGTTTVNNNLTVGGSTLGTTQTTFNLVNGTATTINFGAGATTALNIGASNTPTSLKGNVTLGTSATNTITPNGLMNADLIPTGNGTINLGSSSHYYNTVYANNFVAPVTGGTSGFWSLANDVVYPTQTFFDLAVGGTGTGSATPWQVFSSTVGVNTAGTATSSGNLSFRGATTTINALNDASINFQTSVGGDSGLVSSLYIAPSANNTTSGNIGINTTNPNNFRLQVAGNVGPDASNSYDLGSSSVKWRNVYSVNFTQNGNAVLDTTNVSGNTNRLAKFTGTNTVSSSIITELSSQIGINNTNPQFLLDVATIGNSDTTKNKGGKVGILDDLLVEAASPSALALFNNLDTSAGADIITASSGGVTKFTISKDGNVTQSGTLAVNGNAITTTQSSFSLLNTTATTINFAGGASTALTIGNSSGATTLNGNLTLGSSSSNTITATGQFNSNLIPSATDTYNLGSDPSAGGHEWNNLYVRQIITPNTGGLAGYWQLNSGVLAPANIANDLAIGAIATGSGTPFQVFASARGTIPAGTASTSGQFTFASTGQINVLNGNAFSIRATTTGQGDAGLVNLFNLANNGNISLNTITGASGDTQTISIQGSRGVFGYDGTNGNVFVGTNAGKGLELETNGSTGSTNTRLFISSTNGFVGIGTGNSTSLLGNAQLVINQTNVSGLGDIIAASASGATQFRVSNTGNVFGAQFIDQNNTNYYIDPASSGTSASVSGSLTFDTSTAHTINYLANSSLNFERSVGGDAGLTSTLYLANTGNVGLGTTSPNNQLHIYSAGTSDVATQWETNNSGVTYGSTINNFFPSTASDNSSDTNCTGTIAWSTPTNVEGNDSTFTTATFTAGSQNSHCIQTSIHSFNLNNNVSIKGIVVTVNKKASATNSITDKLVTLLKAGTTQEANRADTSTTWSTTASSITYGSSSDLWGTTWTASDINNTNFGVEFAAQSSAAATASVDYITITVYYQDVNFTAGLQESTGLFKISNSNALGTNDFLTVDPSDGYVGIGSTTPTYQLTVGNSGSQGNNADATIYVNDTNSRGNGRLILSRGSAALDKVGVEYGTAGSLNWFSGVPYNNGLTTNSFVIAQKNYINNGVARAPEFSINTSGDVGIGTASAERPLSIVGTGANGEWIGFQSGTTNTTVWHINNKNGDWNLAETNVSDGRLYVKAGGGVAINATAVTSGYMLDVNGKVRAASGFSGACIGSAFSGSALSGCNRDVAEIYSSSEDVTPGDLLSVDSSTKTTVKKTTQPYQQDIIGVVSTQPGVILGGDGQYVGLGGTTTTYEQTPEALRNPAVALAGRVPVKVSDENGLVTAGDPLTSSSLPGVAMKATQAGKIIGRALENADSSQTTTQSLPNGQNVHIGSIFAFLNLSWYDPDVYLTDTGDLNIFQSNGSYTLQKNSDASVISRIGAFGQAVIAVLKTGSIDAQAVTTQSFAVATENMTIAGQSLQTYIIHTVQTAISNGTLGQANSQVISPLAEVDMLHTNIISPLAQNQNISIAFENSKLEIRNTSDASGSAVATIDNTGNATFSGTLNSKNLAVNNDATISGTLRAHEIEADNITALAEKVSSLSAQNITNVTNIFFATPSAYPTPTSLAANADTSSSQSSELLANTSSSTNYSNPQTTDYTDIASFSAYLSYVPSLHAATAQFDQGLMSFGPTSLSDTTIAGQLAIGGNFILSGNSINVLGADLELQPLKQGGVDIASGQVRIDSNGNLTVNGNAIFAGNLLAKVISPLPGQDLTLKLADTAASTSASQVQIQNASGSAIFAVSQLGDVVASGEATVSKLNFSNVVSQAFAVSGTEIIATGAAGQAKINIHQKEITIDNPLVTTNSLIYITPVGDVNGFTPFLERQVSGKSFTVGVSDFTTQTIQFNWLIVN